ncbi:Rv3235 family protein [Georgenia sp. Z1344]|uniref:Rv3235 family protein n=1 Tax=Georgenia sp. Z1344 TaxID=3416706 RepID=UPI003CEA1B63
MSAQPTHELRPVPLPSGPRLAAVPDAPGRVTRTTPRTGPAVAPHAPRTSDERPWDRVRFSGECRRGAEQFEEEPTGEHAPSTDEGLDRLAAGIAQHAVEALLGSRSAAQLSRWLAPDLYESLSRRVGLAGRLQGRPRLVRHVAVRHVHGCAPSERAREVSVVLHDGERVRAAAVRLEAFRSRWRAVALEIG